MKSTRVIMGMPITVEVMDASVTEKDMEEVFNYFNYVDQTFSPYKPESELSKINQGQITKDAYSPDMVEVLALSAETKKQTNSYFDIQTPQGNLDPSGLVKGWSIFNASQILETHGCKNFYIEAGGDIQTGGKNSQDQAWNVGIRNPFQVNEIIKVVHLSGQGIPPPELMNADNIFTIQKILRVSLQVFLA